MDDASSSDNEVAEIDRPHTAEVRVDLEKPEWARVVCESLTVDNEPKRSNAFRELQIDGRFLVIRVKSSDRKSLQKTIANTMDMCDLAKNTIDMVDKKKWLDNTAPAVKRSRLSSQ